MMGDRTRWLRRQLQRAHAATLAVLVLLVLLAGCADGANSADDAGEQPAYTPPTEGTAISPPRELNDFTMTSHLGEPISLSDLRGKPVLLYFGYTFCPDICPTTLADMVRVRRGLGDQADAVAFVMITVDPQRDTPQVLARYLPNFDESFIGMTGDMATLRRISPDYGVYFNTTAVANTSADYLVDHTAALYLVDSAGALRTLYGYGIPPEVVTTDVQALLAEQPGA